MGACACQYDDRFDMTTPLSQCVYHQSKDDEIGRLTQERDELRDLLCMGSGKDLMAERDRLLEALTFYATNCPHCGGVGFSYWYPGGEKTKKPCQQVACRALHPSEP